MRRFILLFVMCATVTLSFAGDSFGVGDWATLHTYRFDGKKSLILQFRESKEASLQENVVIGFKFANGKILKLTGKKENCVHTTIYERPTEVSCHNSTVWNTYSVNLPLTDLQIEMFKNTLVKIVINTLPNVYAQKVSNERFSLRLYESLAGLKDEFEE